LDNKALEEQDICTKHITPDIQKSRWDIHSQVRQEVTFTDSRKVFVLDCNPGANCVALIQLSITKITNLFAIIKVKESKYRVCDDLQEGLA